VRVIEANEPIPDAFCRDRFGPERVYERGPRWTVESPLNARLSRVLRTEWS
jgi:hypothetical protein